MGRRGTLDPGQGVAIRLKRLLLALGILAASIPSPAVASNFGSQCGVVNGVATCVSLGNTLTHHYWYSGVEANVQAALDWVSLNVYNPTDLNTSEVADSTAADVHVYALEYGANGIWGWVNCPSWAATGGAHPNRWCKPQQLRFNMTYRVPAFDTTFDRRYMACHEFGHTVGLRHTNGLGDPYNNESCMFANSITSNVLTTHDTAHINAAY